MTFKEELQAALAMQLEILRDGVPQRQCSPYGHLMIDKQKVEIIARQTRDVLVKAIKREK